MVDASPKCTRPYGASQGSVETRLRDVAEQIPKETPGVVVPGSGEIIPPALDDQTLIKVFQALDARIDSLERCVEFMSVRESSLGGLAVSC